MNRRLAQTLAGPLLTFALLSPFAAAAETGIVKYFNDKKGFGFIKLKAGPDVFIHKSAMAEGKDLAVGDCLEFDVEQGPKGPRAAKARKIECK